MIDVTLRDGIALVAMRHGKANAMDVEMCDALISSLEEVGNAREARAAVLTGDGKIFGAGVDLRRLLKEGDPYLERFLPLLSQAFEALFFFPKPIIAAINGHAIAGGCVLACATDHRVMARDAGRVGIPELPVGVPFPTIALEIVRFAAAGPQVPSLLYGGATFTSEEALSRGLVDALVPPQSLLQHATQVARTYADRPPGVFALTKRQLREPVAKRLREDGGRFDAEVSALWRSPQTRQALESYVERTLAKR